MEDFGMQYEPGGRCELQIMREMRLLRHPGEFGPEQDICDITLWLNQAFPFSKAYVSVDRHYSQFGREIVDLTVSSAILRPVPLRSAALEAFLALGYKIRDGGGDIYTCPTCRGAHSQHEKLKAYVRIEHSLRVKQSQ